MEKEQQNLARKAENLEKARLASKQVLVNKSPLSRGLEKTRAALDWVYRWGWSTPQILEAVGGAKGSSLARRLEKNGLLAITRSQSGGGVKGVPNYFCTLTELGLAEAERFSTELLPYETNPYRVDQRLFRHDLMAQKATLNGIKDCSITEFKTEKQLAAKGQVGQKEPDILWVLPNGQRVFVEVELTSKWERDLDTFVYNCVGAIFRQRADFIGIVSDAPAIMQNYKEAFAPNAKYYIWKKDDQRKWQRDRMLSMAEQISERVQWLLMED